MGRRGVCLHTLAPEVWSKVMDLSLLIMFDNQSDGARKLVAMLIMRVDYWTRVLVFSTHLFFHVCLKNIIEEEQEIEDLSQSYKHF